MREDIKSLLKFYLYIFLGGLIIAPAIYWIKEKVYIEKPKPSGIQKVLVKSYSVEKNKGCEFYDCHVPHIINLVTSEDNHYRLDLVVGDKDLILNLTKYTKPYDQALTKNKLELEYYTMNGYPCAYAISEDNQTIYDLSEVYEKFKSGNYYDRVVAGETSLQVKNVCKLYHTDLEPNRNGE